MDLKCELYPKFFLIEYFYDMLATNWVDPSAKYDEKNTKNLFQRPS